MNDIEKYTKDLEGLAPGDTIELLGEDVFVVSINKRRPLNKSFSDLCLVVRVAYWNEGQFTVMDVTGPDLILLKVTDRAGPSALQHS